ncbi:MAG: tetratricopeptide repeat protein [Candidatus Eisenbacteria bacterium]
MTARGRTGSGKAGVGRAGRGGKTRARRRRLLIAGLIFGAAWALRLLYVVHLRGSPLADVPVLDELYHVEWARALAAGDWMGSSAFFRAPLYPYLLGAVFSLFGESLVVARVVQATYAALTPVAVYFLGRRVFDERVARLAAVVAAVYPFFIYFSNELLIVSLIVLLDVLMMTLFLRADESPAGRRWFGAGLMMGVSALARPNVLVFLPVLFGWMWWRARQDAAEPRRSAGRPAWGGAFRVAALRFVMVALGVAAAVLPVTLRNYVIDRDLVPIASQGGINFFIGNNASSDGASAVLPVLGESWENEDAIRVAESQVGRKLKPSEVSGFWYGKAREFLLQNPGAAARLYVRKFVLFWDSFELANNKDIYFFGRMSPVFRWLSWLGFGVIGPLAVLGMLVSVRRNSAAMLILLFVLSYMGGVLLFFVNARFRLPIVPMLILFASAGTLKLIELAGRRKVRKLAIALGVLAGVGIFVNHDFYDTHVGDRAQTHMTLGRASAEHGEHEHAVTEYRRAIEISPGYAKAYNSMGLALEQLGRDDEALSAYMTAAETDSSLASVRNNIGSFLLKRGESAEAKEWFEDAIALDEYTEQAHMNLAIVLAQEGDLERAEYHLKCAVTVDPEFEEAWDALGRVLEEIGRLPEAAGAYARAVGIDPSYAAARHDLGVVLAMGGRYDEALRELEAARRLSPNDPRIAANLARVRELIAARGRGD